MHTSILTDKTETKKSSHVLLRYYPALLLAVLVILVSLPVISHTYDDAYITYRYSYNLIEGHGFVYNLGDSNLGTTAPLFGMLLAVLSLPNADWLPSVAGGVSTISLLATCLGLYLFGLRHGRPLAGWVAGLAFAFFPPVLETFGGEMPTVSALVVWSVILYDRGRFGWAGLLIGITTLVRGDGGLLIVILGLHYLITQRAIPWRMGFGFAAPLALWMAYSIPTYGSFLPQTMNAKIAQGESGLWVMFTQGLIRLLTISMGPMNEFFHENAVYRLLPILMAIGVLWAAYQAVRLRISLLVPWVLLLAWPVLHGLIYSRILRVPDYHWYYVPIWLGAAILVGLGFQTVVDFLSRKLGERAGKAGLTLLCLVIALLPMVLSTTNRVYQQRLGIQYIHPYAKVGNWLAENVDPSSTVGSIEIGYIGYYSKLHIIDPMGLVTPGTVQSILDQDFTYAFRNYMPDIIVRLVSLDGFLGPIDQEPWWNCYTLLTRIETVDLYQRCEKVDPHDLLIMDPLVVNEDSLTPPLADRKVISQTFTAASNELQVVGLLMGTNSKTLTGQVTLHLREPDGQADLRTVSLDAAEIEDHEWRLFFFDPIQDSAGKIYEIWLEISGNSDPLVLWMQSGNPNPGGQSYEGGQPITGDFCLRLYYTRAE